MYIYGFCVYRFVRRVRLSACVYFLFGRDFVYVGGYRVEVFCSGDKSKGIRFGFRFEGFW